MASRKKSGGRKAGTPNKATSSLQEQVEAEAGVPLPVLLTRIGIKAMNRNDHQLAVNALSRAAAYTYPRIASVDPDGGSNAAVLISHKWGGGVNVLTPPLIVDAEGKATIPDNWPHPTIRFATQ